MDAVQAVANSARTATARGLRRQAAGDECPPRGVLSLLPVGTVDTDSVTKVPTDSETC